jgi:hypothetical protein
LKAITVASRVFSRWALASASFICYQTGSNLMQPETPTLFPLLRLINQAFIRC